eukprot:m.119020 g.119020  ORF g.119020 m.119020 type:complete len:657 (-) comp16452_c0_seq3:2531-4501(-)
MSLLVSDSDDDDPFVVAAIPTGASSPSGFEMTTTEDAAAPVASAGASAGATPLLTISDDDGADRAQGNAAAAAAASAAGTTTSMDASLHQSPWSPALVPTPDMTHINTRSPGDGAALRHNLDMLLGAAHLFASPEQQIPPPPYPWRPDGLSPPWTARSEVARTFEELVAKVEQRCSQDVGVSQEFARIVNQRHGYPGTTSVASVAALLEATAPSYVARYKALLEEELCKFRRQDREASTKFLDRVKTAFGTGSDMHSCCKAVLDEHPLYFRADYALVVLHQRLDTLFRNHGYILDDFATDFPHVAAAVQRQAKAAAARARSQKKRRRVSSSEHNDRGDASNADGVRRAGTRDSCTRGADQNGADEDEDEDEEESSEDEEAPELVPGKKRDRAEGSKKKGTKRVRAAEVEDDDEEAAATLDKLIAKQRKTYVGSEDEERDFIRNYNKCGGHLETVAKFQPLSDESDLPALNKKEQKLIAEGKLKKFSKKKQAEILASLPVEEEESLGSESEDDFESMSEDDDDLDGFIVEEGDESESEGEDSEEDSDDEDEEISLTAKPSKAKTPAKKAPAKTPSKSTKTPAKTPAKTPGKAAKTPAKTPAKTSADAGSDKLQYLLKSPNVPKKATKFTNFCRNTLKMQDEKEIQKLWGDYQTAKSD